MRAEEVSRTTRPAAKHQDASERGGNDTLTLRLTLLPRNDIGNAERLETLSKDLIESGLLKPHPVIPALTLRQPWASLMAWGLKTVETRGWGTRAIENLAIYAAAQWHGHALEACRENVATAKALASRRLTPEDLPRGKVLAMVDLVGCRQVRPDDSLHWVPAAELARDRQLRMLAAFCAGATNGAEEIGVSDVVASARERPRVAGAPRDLSEELAEGRSVIRFPGRGT